MQPTAPTATRLIRTAPTPAARTPTDKTRKTSQIETPSGALARCVGAPDVFLRDHWGRSPLLTRALGSFDDLASFDDLDHMVSSLGLRESSLRMVKDGTTLAPASYTNAPGNRSRGKERLVNPALVYRHYEEGATIVLEGLQRYWHPLTYFCRDLELEIGHRSQVNAYLTPAGARGFTAHRDTHDVFVLQASGRKRWRVFDRDNDDELVIEHEMEPGDSLYIPEGFPHAAETGAQASAHLTVGIVTYGANDIVNEIVTHIEKGSAFTERLPNLAQRDHAGIRREVERIVDDLRASLDKVDVDEIALAVARRVLSTGQPILRGQLHQLELLEEIDAQTVVRRRRGASCRISRSDDGVRLLLNDRELVMPRVASEAIDAIVRSPEFRVRDLHAFVDAESALVLVRRLVKEGLLEVAA